MPKLTNADHTAILDAYVSRISPHMLQRVYQAQLAALNACYNGTTSEQVMRSDKAREVTREAVQTLAAHDLDLIARVVNDKAAAQ